MSMAVRPIPEGNHSLTPRLVVKDAVSALEFYVKGFGATQPMRHAGPDGKTGYAQFNVGDALVMLAEEGEGAGWRNISPQSLGGSPVMIHLYVADVDAL